MDNANNNEKKENISFFQKYLTLWVFICMIIGVLISKFLPVIPSTLNKFEYANVSIPIAVLIWLMIYPMMMSVDFQSIKNVTKNPSGIFITWVVNWLIKPFTMFFISSLFFYTILNNIIPEDLAKEYLTGAVLLGATIVGVLVEVPVMLTLVKIANATKNKFKN